MNCRLLIFPFSLNIDVLTALMSVEDKLDVFSPVPVLLFQLEQKQVVPPFKPNISGEFGLDNFDAQFTNEPIQLTPDDE